MQIVQFLLALGTASSVLGAVVLPYKVAIIKQAEPDRSFGPRETGILYAPAGKPKEKAHTAISTLVSFKTKYNQPYNLTFIEGTSVHLKGSGFIQVTPVYDFDPDKVTWNKNLELLETFGFLQVHPGAVDVHNTIPFVGFEDEVHFALTPDLYNHDGEAQDLTWHSTAQPASGLVLSTGILD